MTKREGDEVVVLIRRKWAKATIDRLWEPAPEYIKVRIDSDGSYRHVHAKWVREIPCFTVIEASE